MADELARRDGDAGDFERFCTAALPDVYGYLLARCGDRTIAEDLTSETFMAAVSAYRRAMVSEWAVGWLIVVARRRLVDHWRRQARDQRERSFEVDDVADEVDVWDRPVDVDRALAALAQLGPHHRAALTSRYLDGFPVAQVACELDRGLHATEALLQRARRALRRAYQEAPTHA
jgi:RNA polymerase sigma-70 factor (ECF subfamily)